jgi:hypothetical protein
MSLSDRRAQASELLRSGGCNEIEVARLDGFHVAWLTAEGRKRDAALRMVAEELLEEALPCRRFPAYRGQRYFPGHYWLATTGRHVGYESLLERAHLTLLDFDLDVVAVAAQPFVLQWVQPWQADNLQATTTNILQSWWGPDGHRAWRAQQYGDAWLRSSARRRLSHFR